ncbi:unnamed protein product [Protopolystoma xenopodis]|uniref:Uncharacterized protein n=1 Tax=Protopolystoma xenopodis TaxID=117903 RepID=A0A3S5AU00_9PLAT|nr:unnamed protein product [Protopolystoma xenopodis]
MMLNTRPYWILPEDEGAEVDTMGSSSPTRMDINLGANTLLASLLSLFTSGQQGHLRHSGLYQSGQMPYRTDLRSDSLFESEAIGSQSDLARVLADSLIQTPPGITDLATGSRHSGHPFSMPQGTANLEQMIPETIEEVGEEEEKKAEKEYTNVMAKKLSIFEDEVRENKFKNGMSSDGVVATVESEDKSDDGNAITIINEVIETDNSQK